MGTENPVGWLTESNKETLARALWMGVALLCGHEVIASPSLDRAPQVEGGVAPAALRIFQALVNWVF